MLTGIFVLLVKDNNYLSDIQTKQNNGTHEVDGLEKAKNNDSQSSHNVESNVPVDYLLVEFHGFFVVEEDGPCYYYAAAEQTSTI